MEILKEGDIECVDMFYRCQLNIAFVCDGCGECYNKDN